MRPDFLEFYPFFWLFLCKTLLRRAFMRKIMAGHKKNGSEKDNWIFSNEILVEESNKVFLVNYGVDKSDMDNESQRFNGLQIFTFLASKSKKNLFIEFWKMF